MQRLMVVFPVTVKCLENRQFDHLAYPPEILVRQGHG
jgi:hypothetical protein